jgi:hypothetical protein
LPPLPSLARVPSTPAQWPAVTALRHQGCPIEASVPSGKMAPTPLLDTTRPDSLVKMTLGGVSLTLLQTASPSSGPSDLPTHFFAEFDAAKDGPFGSRDFSHLRPRFQRACPCSHVRYALQPEPGTYGEYPKPTTHPLKLVSLPSG